MKSRRLLVNIGRVHDSEDNYTDDYMKKKNSRKFPIISSITTMVYLRHQGVTLFPPLYLYYRLHMPSIFQQYLWQKLPFFKKTDRFSNPAYDVLVSVQHHQIKMFHFSPVTMNFLNKNKLVPLWNLFLAFITTTRYFFISPFYFM